VQFGVTTEELSAAAAELRADGAGTSAADPGCAAGQTSTWSVGRAQRAAAACFELLAETAEAAGTGLVELGDRLGAAAGEYEAVEQRLSPGG
jgi:hypothetical protein